MTLSAETAVDDPPAARARRVVLALAILMLAAKLTIAARTYGTRDINHWKDFVGAVAAHGPVGVYAVRFPSSFYNHPPLVGYLLEGVHLLTEHGVTLQFSIRALASVADVGTALLTFEILRTRRGIAEATVAGALVAVSPVLFVISGYHGNTDPLFLMFTLLALYLLADRDLPLLAGVSLAIAVSIKIVPVEVVPALGMLALTRGTRTTVRFVVGFAAAFLLVWTPALLSQAHAIKADVLEYAGSNVSQWGLTQLGHWAGDPGWSHYLIGAGRFPVGALCALVPAAVVWRRPELAAEAVGLALVAFLFLSPAFGTQYLVWALAPAYLLSSRWATVFNVGAGALLIEVYTRWNHGLPWTFADEWGLDRGEVAAMFAVWIALGIVLVQGVRRVLPQVRDGRAY